MLKSIKVKIEIDELGITVSSLRKTAKRDIALRIKAGEEDANNLKREIKGKIKTKVDVIRRETQLNILNIDETATEEEIAAAVSKEAKINVSEVKLLRQSQTNYGSKNLTIAVNQDTATNLLKKRRIRIGWINCAIKKKVNLLRCYRCLEFGHRREDCKGEDRATNCMNCGEEGHFVNECTNEPKCY